MNATVKLATENGATIEPQLYKVGEALKNIQSTLRKKRYQNSTPRVLFDRP